MTDFHSIEQLDERREAIRWPAKDFLHAAGVSQPTWNRLLSGRGTRLSTIQNLGEALAAEEARLLSYLIKLHPDTAKNLIEASSREAA